MFGGMDPEMMRLAQEQMSRMKPEDLLKMQLQMMNNPELLRMASEGMKNIRPQDLRMAAEQMKNVPPEQIADISSRMANASPEEIAAMRARTEAQRSYEYQGALNLKRQGNWLHGSGKYTEAAEKYLRAKNNLTGIFMPEAQSLQLQCSLNLMSCYLKTKQYQEVIDEGTEILKGDARNLKALYRRGQAYKELGNLKLAVTDLRTAAQLSPDDETIAEVLRQAREDLEKEGGQEEILTDGPIIEEITEDEAEMFSSSTQDSSRSFPTSDRNAEHSSTGANGRLPVPNEHVMGESLNTIAQNPEMLRSMQSMMSTLDPESIAAMSGGGMTPDMAKMAADMMKNMSPDDLERMVGLASQFQAPNGGPTRTESTGGTRQSNTTPSSTSSSSPASGLVTGNVTSTSMNHRSGGTSPGAGMPSMADFSPEMQEQMRNQMKDPAMKQMMASMVKSMSPETMASMSQQMGIKLSPEEAAQAQQAMANLSPDDLDKIMRWAERAQKVTDKARKAKDWMLGKPGLVLAIVMLLIAIFLHRLGYIGS
ncbi:hypothetical protein MPTK1_8g00690 [Marchantia polymorpha subsp. ruderalis]|uniref:Uncharacterized protein n=1 Tax=Marchantia polymorpha TaxID=3197 RepID=A0A2R6WLH9_MARPO|nr:hypothetical protein MARPO_0077s0006 [Marchantia polymorpha]PTQ34673.1 hypothetical protein MARPO_0077s0006 [Marchantia polymorpha]BBN18215.1 hypothetical protein Mp_8g00690 [Marchantia polymorpha subsp. ruderalis]BBN18216.1 hypothetical protein Mp_8g00690 [Marchantia polymorpha subsp. ruderalis]|eukprot:PTQ34671.1 hypothetical protein MARPO_0077s0006 [Marchantia polymorpha]